MLIVGLNPGAGQKAAVRNDVYCQSMPHDRMDCTHMRSSRTVSPLSFVSIGSATVQAVDARHAVASTHTAMPVRTLWDMLMRHHSPLIQSSHQAGCRPVLERI